MDRNEKSILKQERGITWLCGLRFLTGFAAFRYSPSRFFFFFLPCSFSFSTFDLIPFPTIDPRVSLPALPVLYKITLVTTVSARQGGLIRPLGVLTSLGRTNRFNSLPSRCSPRACTTNQPSSAQWFRNCRFFYSFSLPFFLLFFSFTYLFVHRTISCFFSFPPHRVFTCFVAF